MATVGPFSIEQSSFCSFPVHRQTMTESSKYFQAMLGPNFREGSEEEIVLPHINGTTLQLLIDFCYFGHATITRDNVEELIEAAASMEFVQLEQDCCEFLIDNLTVDNCLDALFMADTYNSTKLKQKTLQFIRDHFEDVALVDVHDISYENVVELLKYEQYKIPECIIFDRLVRWIYHNRKERTKYVPVLVQYVRLEHIQDDVSSAPDLINEWKNSNFRFFFLVFPQRSQAILRKLWLPEAFSFRVPKTTAAAVRAEPAVPLFSCRASLLFTAIYRSPISQLQHRFKAMATIQED